MRGKKILSVAVSFALMLSMLPAQAVTAPADQLAGQWYEAAMTTAVERGIIGGDESGNLQPARNITRGEMAVMLDRIMDYQAKAGNKFGDLVGGVYYTDAILAANAAGILKGDDRGNVKPAAGITRQETAVMLARVMNIEGIDAPSGNFADQSSIAPWAVKAVNAMKAAGYMGAQEVNFRPTDAITRAEVATVLGNIFTGYFNEAKTYSANVNGSAVVNAAGATLKNMKVSGDLIVAEGVAEGNLYLDGVTVGGRLLVRGGGVNSVYIRGASQVGNVIVSRQDGPVRVVVEGGAKVEVVVVDDGSDAVRLEGTLGSVVIEGTAAVEVAGTVGTVTVDAADASLKVSGTVAKVATTGNATGAVIEAAAGGKITAVEANGAGTQITGSGKVDSVTAKANDVSVATPGTKVEAAPGTSGVTAGGKPVEGGSTSGGSSTGGGGGYVPTPDPAVANVSTIETLTAALADVGKTTINITGNIDGIENTIKLERQVTIDGKGNKLSFATYPKSNPNGERNGILVAANGVHLKDIKIALNNNGQANAPEAWQGAYGVQVYNAENVVLHGYTGVGGDAALLVNNSKVTLTGAVDVSGNEFGGIEVTNRGTLMVDASVAVVNTTESKEIPTIWIDGEGTVEGTNGLVKTETSVETSKKYYYIADVATKEALRAALTKDYLKHIEITADMGNISETLVVNHAVEINGNGKTLSFGNLSEKAAGQRNGLLVMSDNVKIQDITVAMAPVEGWKGIYGVQVYNVKNVELNNYTGTGGDAALLVNGAKVTLTGTTTVSGNEFGGVEVAKEGTLTINGDIVNANEDDAHPTVWIDGVGSVTGSNVLKDNERALVNGTQKYYYIGRVATEEALRAALTKDYLKHIEVAADMGDISETLVVNHAVTINGNGKTLSFVKFSKDNTNGERNGILVEANGVQLKNMKIQLSNNDNGWEGAYGIQVYNVTDVVLEECTISGGDAALLVNGSTVTLTGITTVSSNEFGGIEVSKGAEVGLLNSELTVSGTIVNTTERQSQPTVWVIDNQGSIMDATKFRPEKVEGKTYYYLKQKNPKEDINKKVSRRRESAAGTPFQQVAIFFEKGLDNLRAFGIINPALTEWAQKIAGLCKGSTTDSDSVCEGSNPSPAAMKEP